MSPALSETPRKMLPPPKDYRHLDAERVEPPSPAPRRERATRTSAVVLRAHQRLPEIFRRMRGTRRAPSGGLLRFNTHKSRDK